jgi:hypothetical protein
MAGFFELSLDIWHPVGEEQLLEMRSSQLQLQDLPLGIQFLSRRCQQCKDLLRDILANIRTRTLALEVRVGDMTYFNDTPAGI